MKQSICLRCERCNSKFCIASPSQIGLNIGRDRILCENCFEWEMIPASF